MIDKEFRKVVISKAGTFRVDIKEAIAGGVSGCSKCANFQYVLAYQCRRTIWNRAIALGRRMVIRSLYLLKVLIQIELHLF